SSTQASINSTSANKTYTGSRNTENTASQAFSALHSRTSNSYSTGINETQNKSAGHAGEGRRVANEYDDKHQGRTHQATSFENTFANGANTGSRNGENTTSQDYSFSRPEAGHSYDNIDHGESQIENKNSDLYILAAVFLLLLALGLGGIYLVDISSESTKSRSTKAVNYRDSYEARAPKTTAPSIAASTIEAVNNIEPEPVKIAPSENQSLNEVAVEDEAMPEPSANSRVFELHINEKSDSEQYAITSFEPVEHQRETTPDTQQFTHIVVKGDTLWHITRRYLDNPHRYPELAAASHINNPHRIYPGDVIKIIVNRAKNKN
ncbi:MAG: LysM peptidoglycan-binding domain-containing protein, partial [Gammaproteobacteria bacterium]|nr:LysM peptidoglycan-binding domain-containing protein [Gammaproteobacteria bacterium]